MASNKIVFNRKYAPLFNPACPCRYFIVTGGRGSGKSYAISSAVATDHATADYNILYLRQTLVSAKVSIIPEFYEKLELMGLAGIVTKSNTDMRNTSTNFSMFFRGIQTSRGSNEAQLKSIKRIGLALVDEAQELVDEAAFDRIDLTLRDVDIKNRVILSLNPTDKKHWIYRRFFAERNVPDDFNGIVGDTCYIHTDYRDNRQHLNAKFLQMAEECKERNYQKYLNIYLGFWAGNTEGALWNEELIAPYRVAAVPMPLERIVVAVDPAVTSAKGSDETGIVVAGSKTIRGQRHYFVLADRSAHASPSAWAAAVVNAYNEYRADRVVAETNNGGDMVEQMLRQAAQRVPYKAVHASRGKIVRAEPVAALYEKGLVHHCGSFGQLEWQMCNYCGYDKEASPDRMDALVWAITELSSKRGSGPIV